MMKQAIFTLLMILLLTSTRSQSIYFTRNGSISFFSKTPLEDIAAHNNEVSSMIDFSKNELVFYVLIKSFSFKKTLMQTHFNENYMESDKFPKASFKGKITDAGSFTLSKDGTYPVITEGDLTIHGVTQKIKTKGNIKVVNGKVTCTSNFQLDPEDYDIKIPSVVRNKIADVIDVQVNCEYELYTK